MLSRFWGAHWAIKRKAVCIREFRSSIHAPDMIHPSLELRFIGPEVGYGVFATELIPKGTLTYVEDDLEIRIPEEKFDSYQPSIRTILDNSHTLTEMVLES